MSKVIPLPVLVNPLHHIIFGKIKYLDIHVDILLSAYWIDNWRSILIRALPSVEQSYTLENPSSKARYPLSTMLSQISWRIFLDALSGLVDRWVHGATYRSERSSMYELQCSLSFESVQPEPFNTIWKYTKRV